jgi:hypothetical protein
MNYNMLGMLKSLDELLGLLKTVEEDMNKGSRNVLAISSAGKKIKKHSKCKSKGKAQVVTLSTSKPNDISDVECFYCKKHRHWKRNCPQFLEDKRTGTSLLLQVYLLLKLSLLLLFLTGCWASIHVLIFF